MPPHAAGLGRVGVLPGLSNHPSPSTTADRVLGHQGHRASAKLLRWHLLEQGAGQDGLCAVLGTGAAPHPYEGKGMVGSYWQSQACAGVPATATMGAARTGRRLLHPPSRQMSLMVRGHCSSSSGEVSPLFPIYGPPRQPGCPLGCAQSRDCRLWADIPVSPPSPPNFTWWLLCPWHCCHHPSGSPTAKRRSCFSASLLCLRAASQAGHICPPDWGGHSQLELLGESLLQEMPWGWHRNGHPSTTAGGSWQPCGRLGLPALPGAPG